METRNVTFMVYGFVAAWLILCAYVVTLVARERKLKRELERLRLLIQDKEKT
jgi:CcmD family protein